MHLLQLWSGACAGLDKEKLQLIQIKPECFPLGEKKNKTNNTYAIWMQRVLTVLPHSSLEGLIEALFKISHCNCWSHLLTVYSPTEGGYLESEIVYEIEAKLICLTTA